MAKLFALFLRDETILVSVATKMNEFNTSPEIQIEIESLLETSR